MRVYPCKDVDIAPREVRLEYDMPYNGVHYECGKSLMCARENLVGKFAVGRNLEEEEKQLRPALEIFVNAKQT